MRVFLAGATGAVGRPLVKQLSGAGHEVVAITRSRERAESLREAGVEALVCDALDADAVRQAVCACRPEAILNQLTALSGRFTPRRYRAWVAPTNRLRREGTRNLVDAALAAGTRLFVSQSLAFAYRRDGTGLKTEEDALFDADMGFGPAVAAIRELEQMTLQTPGLTGVVLRYGWLYGPGTAFASDGDFARMTRRRAYPIVGPGTGVFSFIHVEDAAAAAARALERGRSGTFNIVDDDPAPMSEWLPAYAEALGAPRPLRVPLWLARLGAARFVAETGVHVRGASNARAKQELGWEPRWRSWREGFRAGAG
jgi:nucleoside-diphosphate-sugar epimerase